MASRMSHIVVVLILALNLVARLSSAAVISDRTDGTSLPDKYLKYLENYGYLSKNDVGKSKDVRRALSTFQTQMGLNPNGRLTKVTKKLMISPRCGEKDIDPHENEIEYDQFSMIRSAMRKKEITYSIKRWTEKISRKVQNQTLYHMLRLWADDMSMNCSWVNKTSLVNIVFKTGEASKNRNVQTEVSHANNIFTIYFYSDATRSVKALRRASVHAFGHVFGHKHSNLYSIMSPIFRHDTEMIIDGRCEISLTTAFSFAHNGITYFFKESLVWWLRQGSKVHSPPHIASTIFHGLPLEIDDGFTWGHNWETYMFKGSQYYRYDSVKDHVGEGYPYPISKGWRGVPDNIDAVFTDAVGITYFFKDDQTYMFDDAANHVHPDYPKKISDVFPGLPNTIDTVFRYYSDGYVYFFKGLYYWVWNDKLGRAEGPKVTMYDWIDLCLPRDV